MSDDRITAEEIETWLEASRETSASLARLLGVNKATTGRWLKGDSIPEPADKLLRLLIRGEVPFGLLPNRSSLLRFSPVEWRIIEIMRTREGYSNAHDWIAAKIRLYIAMSSPPGGREISLEGDLLVAAEGASAYNLPADPDEELVEKAVEDVLAEEKRGSGRKDRGGSRASRP